MLLYNLVRNDTNEGYRSFANARSYFTSWQLAANENRLEKIKKIFISALLNPNSSFFEFVISPQ